MRVSQLGSDVEAEVFRVFDDVLAEFDVLVLRKENIYIKWISIVFLVS